MSEAIRFAGILGAFVFVPAAMITILVGLAVEDRIIERVHRLHREVWDAAGRPMGGTWWSAPEGAERSFASRQRGLRAMKVWAAATDGQSADDSELVSLLRWRRTLTRWTWILMAAAIIGLWSKVLV